MISDPKCPKCDRKTKNYKKFSDGSECWTHKETKVVEWANRTLRLPIFWFCYDNLQMKEKDE